jgi:four helix bundle protein
MRASEVPMQDYRKLDVWTKAHELAVDVHRAVGVRGAAGNAAAGASPPATPPGSGETELLATVRRAAVRVPVLIVRGCEGETAAEFSQAMREAALATDEFAYLLRLSRDAAVLEAVPYAKLEARTNQLRAMLGALNRTVRLKLREGVRPAAAKGVAARGVKGAQDDDSSRRESRPRSTS